MFGKGQTSALALTLGQDRETKKKGHRNNAVAFFQTWCRCRAASDP